MKENDYKDKNGNSITPLGPTVWGGSDRPWAYNDLVFTGPGGEKFAKDGSDVKHESMTNYGEERVKYIRDLLDEGLMHPEFFTMEENRAKEGILIGSLNVVGQVSFPIKLGILTSFVFTIPMALLVSRVLGLGIYGIWLVFILDETMRSFIFRSRWAQGLWIIDLKI